MQSYKAFVSRMSSERGESSALTESRNRRYFSEVAVVTAGCSVRRYSTVSGSSPRMRTSPFACQYTKAQRICVSLRPSAFSMSVSESEG